VLNRPKTAPDASCPLPVSTSRTCSSAALAS
jgi:hypothetical protein